MQHNLISFLSKGKAVSKILSCCAVLVFVFVLISTDYQVSAAGVPIQVPTVPFELGPLIKSYDDLNDEQKKIADAIAGGYGTAYSGYAGYSYDGTWTDAAHELSEQITKYGSNIYNTFRKYLGDTGTELLLNPVGFGITALQDLLGGAVSYASQWTGTFSDWWDNNIYDADAGGGGGGHSFVVDGDVSMNQGFMNLFGPGIGLFDWQLSSIPVENIGNWEWLTNNTVSAQDYNNAVNSYLGYYNNIVRANVAWGTGSPPSYYYSVKLGNSIFDNYTNLFINTNTGYAYLCNDDGNILNARVNVTHVADIGVGVVVTTGDIYVSSRQYSIVGFSNIGAAVDYIFTHSSVFQYYSSSNYVAYPCLNDFVRKVYVGADWASKREYTPVDDLNFDDTYERTVIDNPAVPWALDLAKLIRSLIDDLAGTRDAVDGVTIKDATIGATIDKVTGLDITDAQVQKIAVQLEYPESGIIIPDGIFGDSMSYIEYLWNFTKPLVLYTRDLLHTLLFNGNGIAWIVYGIISVGLIGGVIVKFLL